MKKSPNDAVNKFKLRLINAVLDDGNEILSERYRPFADFSQFNTDDVPTNSDVVLVLGQYLEQLERFRSDNVRWSRDVGRYIYVIDDGDTSTEAAPPSMIKGAK